MIKYIKENIKNIPINFIKGVRLLTLEEFRRYEDNILNIKKRWWLDAPHITNGYHHWVYGVRERGDLYSSYEANSEELGIRPVLVLDLSKSDLKVGDRFKFGGYAFKILSDEIALCENIVGKCFFNYNLPAKTPGTNIYEGSEIQSELESWFYAKKNKIKTNS